MRKELLKERLKNIIVVVGIKGIEVIKS